MKKGTRGGGGGCRQQQQRLSRGSGARRSPARSTRAAAALDNSSSPSTSLSSRLSTRSITWREDAWSRAEAERTRHEWELVLTERERMEIRDAAAYLVDESTNVRREEITRKSFSFSGNFSGKLEKVRSDLLKGRGFALIRGVPLEFLSTEEERAAAALCLGSYFGKLLPQNGKGHVLGHVKDIGLDANNPNHRIYATSAAQPFHTDSADIVGLLCINKAMEGGLSSFCSSTRIFRQILKERPDLADVLTRPFHVDRKGKFIHSLSIYLSLSFCLITFSFLCR